MAQRHDAEHFIGLLLSNSSSILLQPGLVTESQLSLDDFRARAHALLGDAAHRWYFSYHVRLSVK